MSQIAIRKTLFGCFALILGGVGVVTPGYPADPLDTIWMVVVIVSGIYLCVEGAGPQDIRLRFLDWWTSRWGKGVEWSGTVIFFGLYIWDFGLGFPSVLLAAVGLGASLPGNTFEAE